MTREHANFKKPVTRTNIILQILQLFIKIIQKELESIQEKGFKREHVFSFLLMTIWIKQIPKPHIDSSI